MSSSSVLSVVIRSRRCRCSGRSFGIVGGDTVVPTTTTTTTRPISLSYNSTRTVSTISTTTTTTISTKSTTQQQQQQPEPTFSTIPSTNLRRIPLYNNALVQTPINHHYGQQYQNRLYSSSTTLWKKSNNQGDNNKDPVPTYDDASSSSLSDIETMNYEGTDFAKEYTMEQLEAIVADEERKMEEALKAKFVENWKPGMRKRPLEMSFRLDEFQYELDPNPDKPKRWSLLNKRCGGLGIKVGMVPVYDPIWGVRYPCTVLYMDTNIVVGHKTVEKHGYSAVVVAAGERKRKNVGKSVLGQFQHVFQWDNQYYNEDDEDEDEDYEGDDETTNLILRQNPPYLVREFRITDEELSLIPVGQQIHASHFIPGQNVDISGISKGKGFQGAMKLHNFGGMPASHGVSRSHRALGSTGQCQDPGRVFKGKKMAGHMGVNRVTTQNLRILKIDRGRNLVYIIGSVPGNKGSFVEIRDAVKRPGWNKPSMVGTDHDYTTRPPLPTYPFDPTVDGTGVSGHEQYMPMPTRDPLLPDREDVAA